MSAEKEGLEMGKRHAELEKYYKYSKYAELRERLDDAGFKEIAEESPRVKYLCNKQLKSQVTTVISSVIPYLIAYYKSLQVPIFRQEPMRPLSVILFGPPGVGKTTFVDKIGEYLNRIFDPKQERRVFEPVKANIAEFERLETLGQILIGLRNRKIDANYPPLLFLDEADVSTVTFSRLLTVLWDGKFFWGEHRRDLGAMIIFLAVSVVRCRWRFDSIINAEKSAKELANPKVTICRYKNNRNEPCAIDKSLCFFESKKNQWKNKNEDKILELLKKEEPWEEKGSDFLSRVNGPIVFLPDLTLEPAHRAQLFEKFVKGHLEKLGQPGRRVDTSFVKDNKPRYSVRSLCLLAESLDILQIEEEYIGTNAYNLMHQPEFLRIHFPEYQPSKRKKEPTGRAQ